MDFIEGLAEGFNHFIGSYVVPTEVLMVALLGTGFFLTLRLGFIQLRRLKHGLEVTSGKYDDPDEPGDVTHFQALTTALSATVGVGNIAGVAAAIHWGGPGALLWMWMTAFFGMAVKYSEVTLALKYRRTEEDSDSQLAGSVSGGPMYYIERGLGKNWKPLAIFFALGLMMTSFMTGNAVQANTLTDQVNAKFGISPYITGIFTVAFIALIIFGGIKRIGRVTSILAPVMACLYVGGALIILAMNLGDIFPAFGTIISEAFNPTAGVAGTGIGALLATMTYGVQRGLFSNEAGQGSAPIAHAAAQTNEPVSEGVVALLEPFIDTIVICTITGLVIVTTGVWNAKFPTELEISSGDVSYRYFDTNNANVEGDTPSEIIVVDGVPQYANDAAPRFSWHEAPVDKLFTDEAQTIVFSGRILPEEGRAVAGDGTAYEILYGNAVETGAPMTSKAFGMKLGPIGEYIVLFCVVLFAISTAISWSYYGDRCANYIFGRSAIIPYKILYLVFHYVGATASLQVIWDLGDTALSIVTLPNLLALVLLSGIVVKETNSYFDRKPYENSNEG